MSGYTVKHKGVAFIFNVIITAICLASVLAYFVLPLWKVNVSCTLTSEMFRSITGESGENEELMKEIADELEKKPDAPQESAEKKPERKNDFDNRRKLMYVLCGGYLIYLAIKMGRDYPGLAASGVWSSDRIIALCGAIAFSIIGAALLVITAVRSVREWKQDAQNEQEEHTDE